MNEYTNYPDVAKRINKATGGPTGRMPFWFQFSKNGRRDITTNKKHKRQWAKPNNSTMNRICRAFDDIGKISMNYDEIPPYNWEMLLSERLYNANPDIATEFIDLDNIKISLAIGESEESPADKNIIDNNTVIDEYIAYMLTKKFGPLEYCYPHIVKYMFTDEGSDKSSHKQTFWRIFGDIALENLRKNLEPENHIECLQCHAKIPVWGEQHECVKNAQGFAACKDCNKRIVKTNSRQNRCPLCQNIHNNELRRMFRNRCMEEKRRLKEEFLERMRKGRLEEN